MLECPVCTNLTAYAKATKLKSKATFFCPTCKTRLFFDSEMREIFHATIIKFIDQIRDEGRILMLADKVAPARYENVFCLVCGKKTCLLKACRNKPKWYSSFCRHCGSKGFMSAKSTLSIV